MREYLKFYINGEWVDPTSPNKFDVINPASEGVCAQISLGNEVDVDKAVKAARVVRRRAARSLLLLLLPRRVVPPPLLQPTQQGRHRYRSTRSRVKS